ncbi:MAG: glycosyltransferase [Candidatus Kariarchaeaceae archaeon]
MILVTVGLHHQPFDRLIKGADDLAGQIDEKVIIQRGSSNIIPYFADHFQWTSSKHMELLTQDSRIVITQASAGAILLSLKYKKPVIAIPRLRRFKENFDNHQLELALALKKQGKVVVVDDPTRTALRSAIIQAKVLNINAVGPDKLVGALRQKLMNWV